jgi:hypothetical protein
VDIKRLCNLSQDWKTRIEMAQGILIDDLQCGALLTPPCRSMFWKRLSLERYFTLRGRLYSEQQPSQGRFSASRLSDQTDSLPAAEREGHPVDGSDFLSAGEETNAAVVRPADVKSLDEGRIHQAIAFAADVGNSEDDLISSNGGMPL